MLTHSSIRHLFSSHKKTTLRDSAGGVAIIMGLMLVPLIGVVGLAVDSARAYSVKMRLQEAIDAAALVGGRNYTDTDRDQQIESYFLANWKNNFQNTGEPPTLANKRLVITTDPKTREVIVAAEVTMPTMIVQILPGAPNTITISNQGAAVKGDTKLEVAIALDNTTSMVLKTDGTIPSSDSERRLEDMKKAAKNFVDLLYTDDKGIVQDKVENMWVSLVPFTSMVNVGPKNTNFLVPGMINKIQWDFPAAKTNFGSGHDSWAGCVFERSQYVATNGSTAGYAGRDLTDDPPSTEKFQPYFVPAKGYEIFRNCPNVCKKVYPDCTGTGVTPPVTPPTTPPACYKYFDGYAIPCSFNPKNLRERRETLLRSVVFRASGPHEALSYKAHTDTGRYQLAGGTALPTLIFGPGPTAYPFTFNGVLYTGYYESNWAHPINPCTISDPYGAVLTTPGAYRTEYCLMGEDATGNNDWRTRNYMCANHLSEWCTNMDVNYYLAFKRKLGGAVPLYGASADLTGSSTDTYGFLQGDATYGKSIKNFCSFGEVKGGPGTDITNLTSNTYGGDPTVYLAYQELSIKTMHGRWITPVIKGGKTIMSGWGNSGCGLPLVPLQEKRSVLASKIDDMEVADLPPNKYTPSGSPSPIDHPDNGYSGTLINEGLVWAWRTLSPSWRGIWKDESGTSIDGTLPLDYNVVGASKAIVIMTDGLNFLEDSTWNSGALKSASIMDRTGGVAGAPTAFSGAGGYEVGIKLTKAENPVLVHDLGYSMNDVDSSAYGVLPGNEAWYYKNYDACLRRALTPTAAPYNFDGYEDTNTCSIFLPKLRTTAHGAAPFTGGYAASSGGADAKADASNMNTGPYYDELEYRLGKTCQNIRNKGVRIYFVLFAVNNTHPLKTRAMNSFTDCVSNMGKVYDAVDAVQLNAAFKDIAASIRQLRLSQ